MQRLYETFGHLYDLHTPPQHYQHDHRFVLDLVAPLGNPPRLLDLGCGTGVLLEKAKERGYITRGLDAAEGMVWVARARLGADVVALRRMQELDEPATWDAVTALSWVLHYCTDEAELVDVLSRCRKALRPGRLLVAQLAHAPGASGEWYEDREPGPDDKTDDVVLRYRFAATADSILEASYDCTCHSTGEHFEETHHLRMADAHRVARCAEMAGLVNVRLLGSWKGEPFEGGLSGWLIAACPGLP